MSYQPLSNKLYHPNFLAANQLPLFIQITAGILKISRKTIYGSNYFNIDIIKRKGTGSDQNQDGNFYENYIADTAIAIVPEGVFNKDEIVKQMSSSSSQFKSIAISDRKTIVLNDESGIVTYKALYENHETKKQLEVFVTTVYARIENEWKGVFYQQTPMLPVS